MKILLFKVNEKAFASDIVSVREVCLKGDVVEVPSVPGYIEGVMHYRGGYLPLMDAGAIYGIKQDSPRFVIVVEGNPPFGLVVSRIEGIVDVDGIEALPPVSKEASMVGVVEYSGDFAIVIDPSKLVRGRRKGVLRKAIEGVESG